MHDFPDLTNKTITFQINDNLPIAVLLTGITSLLELSNALNTTEALEQANEHFGKSLHFATISVDGLGKGTITLQVDDNTSGKIVLIGETSSASNLFFNEVGTPETTHTVYADGDYYLELDPITDTINMVKTESATNIPDVPFYTHYVVDNRHTFIDPEVQKTHTDEDDLQFYMYPYKVAGIQNIFTRPVFTTFDLKADVFCSKAIPREQIKFNVSAALKSAYSLSAAEFNKPVIRAEVTKVIMDVPGVRYVEIRYFGKDMIDQTTNVANKVEAGFDEIIVMSDDTFDSKGAQLHGQEISYNVI